MSNENIPCRKTIKQVNDVMRDKLGGVCMSSVTGNNSQLEFWVINQTLVIVQMFNGDGGWTHFINSKQNTIEGTIAELQQL